jgi:hypothetical protein
MSGSDDTSRKQPNAQIKYKDIRFCEMTERAALIKWWDALDAIRDVWNECSVEEGLRLACLSSHPDAQWLVSLFPPGAEETRAYAEGDEEAARRPARHVSCANVFGERNDAVEAGR